MKVGDKVIYRMGVFEGEEKATIINIIDEDNIRIEFENQFWAGDKVIWWTEQKNITLDKEWYREEKLKELGI